MTELLLGTVSAVSGTYPTASVNVIMDGATVATRAVVPDQFKSTLYAAGAVGARVMGARVGKRFYITEVISGGADGVWINLTLVNSWVNFDSGLATGGTGRACGYTRINGIVYLRGVMKTGASNVVAFTMPAGYRMEVAAASEGEFPIGGNQSSTDPAYLIQNATNGQCTPFGNTISGFCFLTGAHYPAGS